MDWNKFYELVDYGEVSKAMTKLPELKELGIPYEVASAVIIIGSDDKAASTQLLNMALQQGVKFSCEDLYEMQNLCSEDCWKKALYQSAESYNASDLEYFAGYIDDELVIDISRKFNIPLPEDFVMEHEEELKPDAKEPITWERFYEAYNRWSDEYSVKRSYNISTFGEEDEVIEVANVLFGSDKAEASDFIHRAVSNGVTFGVYNLLEITALCDERVVREAVLASRKRLKSRDLEELYGEISDELIKEVAKKERLKLPEDMQSEYEYIAKEKNDFNYDVQVAINMADYALQCLEQAKVSMKTSSNVSLFDMFTKGFIPSYMKYASLEESEDYIIQARDALENLNLEISNLMCHKDVRIKYARLASMIDAWMDNTFMDCLVHLQIGKVQKNIDKAIRQVNEIKYELRKISWK